LSKKGMTNGMVGVARGWFRSVIASAQTREAVQNGAASKPHGNRV